MTGIFMSTINQKMRNIKWIRRHFCVQKSMQNVPKHNCNVKQILHL